MTSHTFNVIKENDLVSSPEIKFGNGIIVNINREMKKMFDKIEPFDNLLSYNNYILNKSINKIHTNSETTRETFRKIVNQPVERITVPQCSEVKIWFLFKEQNKLKIMTIVNGTDTTMEITELGEFKDRNIVKAESKSIKYSGRTDISTEEILIDKSSKIKFIIIIVIIIISITICCIFCPILIRNSNSDCFLLR